MMNIMYLIASCVVVLLQLSSASVILNNIRSEDSNQADFTGPVRPLLSSCSGHFIRTEYILQCMVNTDDVSFSWRMNGTVISTTSRNKYHVQKETYMDYTFLKLKIWNITGQDVGRYELLAFNAKGLVVEELWITNIEACDSLMRCFENSCEWPTKMVCNSRPAARCVVDMCSASPDDWCMPKWFEGLNQVTCEEEDSFYTDDQDADVTRDDADTY